MAVKIKIKLESKFDFLAQPVLKLCHWSVCHFFHKKIDSTNVTQIAVRSSRRYSRGCQGGRYTDADADVATMSMSSSHRREKLFPIVFTELPSVWTELFVFFGKKWKLIFSELSFFPVQWLHPIKPSYNFWFFFCDALETKTVLSGVMQWHAVLLQCCAGPWVSEGSTMNGYPVLCAS